jgi:hypothetical protein
LTALSRQVLQERRFLIADLPGWRSVLRLGKRLMLLGYL